MSSELYSGGINEYAGMQIERFGGMFLTTVEYGEYGIPVIVIEKEVSDNTTTFIQAIHQLEEPLSGNPLPLIVDGSHVHTKKLDMDHMKIRANMEIIRSRVGHLIVRLPEGAKFTNTVFRVLSPLFAAVGRVPISGVRSEEELQDILKGILG